MVALAAPEALEVPEDQHQDHPENQKPSVYLESRNYSCIKFTIVTVSTMTNYQVYIVYRVFVPFLPLFLHHRVFLGTLELHFLPEDTTKKKHSKGLKTFKREKHT